MKKLIIGWIITLFIVTPFIVSAETIPFATGSKTGMYANALFNTFNKHVMDMSDGEYELERIISKGTSDNLKKIKKGDAAGAFIQICGLVNDTDMVVETVAPVVYELAHLVVPKKGGKVSDIDDLESKKKNSVGITPMSGSAITFSVFQKEDKDYKNAQITPASGMRAFSKMTTGDLDSIFWVSGPRTKMIKTVNSNEALKFASVDDGDFDDFKWKGKKLYHFVKVGKKEGYKNKFKTIAVPGVVVFDSKFLQEHEEDGLFDILFMAAEATRQEIKSRLNLKYYPK
ncbi:MAG: TAXI family TRAP transporter solute-binding subunit [Draconibacterium sp.]|nr:TAXI family TRAP transporter solute-binding subunit [Draconibacterium sp.]